MLKYCTGYAGPEMLPEELQIGLGGRETNGRIFTSVHPDPNSGNIILSKVFPNRQSID